MVGADEWLCRLDRWGNARWREEWPRKYRNQKGTLGAGQNKPDDLASRKEPYKAEGPPTRREDHIGMKREKEKRRDRLKRWGRVEGAADGGGEFWGKRRRAR